MSISIATRLKPFSHIPGAKCLIPGTHFAVQAFPTLIRIGEWDIPWPIQGAMRPFTLQQDLENNAVWILRGMSRTCITASVEGFTVSMDREKRLFPAHIAFHLPQVWEKISFGSHAEQDWELILRRAHLQTILPILYGLGQKIPPLPAQSLTGTARLLENLTDKKQWEAFCLAAFHSLLVPRLKDDQYQGFCPDEEVQGHPCYLIQEAYRHLRASLLRQEGDRLHFLPAPVFEAGRGIDFQVEGIGLLNFEWAKGQLRRAILRATQSREVRFDFSKEVRTFRWKTRSHDRGHIAKGSDPLLIEEGKTYWLDHFYT